jgi:SpoVK/Ycf46/Vps4 family AAA+-type ATPase
VSLPDAETRTKIFEIHLRKTPVSDEVSVRDLAMLTDGYSGAEVRRFDLKMDAFIENGCVGAVLDYTARRTNLQPVLKSDV